MSFADKLNSGRPLTAVGLMTGTALDGYIDTAMVRTNGLAIETLGQFLLHPYDAALRARLADSIEAARAWNFIGDEPQTIREAERDYTLAHAEAVMSVARSANMQLSDIDVVGFHGLTVLHRPARQGGSGRTLQIGNGPLLAQLLGVPVAYDFRSADVAEGGEGAPLAPIYHQAMLDFAGRGRPVAILNLGGVANLTWLGEDGVLAAFDCGPANGPINEWIEGHDRGAYDIDGRLAAAGIVHQGLIAQWLDHPWFDQPYPKSLDRYDFNAAMARGLSLADGAATLTAFSAACVKAGMDVLPSCPKVLIVAGGGRKNPVLMAMIAAATGLQTGVTLLDADQVGLRGDAVEAEAFAHLAVRTAKGLPISFPGTTGVAAPLTGGRMAYPV
jgi:anhydro-N-acetylmuramic acid kinase